MYQALYRKYRPLIFSDVVGQTAITDTLRSQVSGGKLSHAYLFTGTRGTGKTTCAKILARAANCLSPKGGNPCNVCAPCVGALENSLLDVVEIDAASNSGVDNIRALRDEAAYVPTVAKKRVYIIDEVHMLSSGAFNALLKTLEEPPPHVLFILATTETHKVPATILSRCQRFAFRRLSEHDITERLLYVAEREKILLTNDAAKLLARLADGALRDGLSLLDQVASSAEGTIDVQKAELALGLAGSESINSWAEAITGGDVQNALAVLKEQIDLGRDIASLLGELSQVLRSALLAKLQDLSTDNVPKVSSERLLYMLTTVQNTLNLISRSPQPRTEAELCIIKICGLQPKSETVFSPVVAQVKKSEPEAKPAPKPEPKPEPQPEPAAQLPEPLPEPLPARSPSAVSSDEFKQRAAERLSPSLKSFLLNGQIELEQGEGLWKVITPDDITLDRLSQPGAIKAMEETAAQIAGHPVSVRVSLKPQPKKNPKLQTLFDNFNE